MVKHPPLCGQVYIIKWTDFYHYWKGGQISIIILKVGKCPSLSGQDWWSRCRIEAESHFKEIFKKVNNIKRLLKNEIFCVRESGFDIITNFFLTLRNEIERKPYYINKVKCYQIVLWSKCFQCNIIELFTSALVTELDYKIIFPIITNHFHKYLSNPSNYIIKI